MLPKLNLTGKAQARFSWGSNNSGDFLEEVGYNTSTDKWTYTCVNGQYGWLMCYYGYSQTDPDFKAYISYDSI